MKKVFIIGTLHLNFTPKDELEAVLEQINPDQVLVELSPSEFEQPRTESIRDEMFVAYDWAVAHHKKVDYFDNELSPLKDGVTGKEPEFVENELQVKALLKEYSWKDLNKEAPWAIPEVAQSEAKIVEKYFDVQKSKEREYFMLSSINEKLIEGTNVVVTGAGHLSFFKKEIPDAVLPLRD